MLDSSIPKIQDILPHGKFYGKSTPYFKRLSMLPHGKQILEGYAKSICTAAEKQSPYCFFASRDEFVNNNIASIKKELKGKVQALIYLAEKMGYEVKNKNDDIFIDEDIVGFMLEIGNKCQSN